MASSISSGFPGVRTKIVDSSQYIEALSSNMIGFICICSEKGPDNVPRMTTSASDFIRTYGAPNSAKYGQGGYVALQYLKTLSNLYVMRVLPNEATYAFKAMKLASEDTVTTTTYQKYYTEDENGNKVEHKVELAETKEDNAVLVTAEELALKDLATIVEENTTYDEEGNVLTTPVVIIPESVDLNYTIDPTVKMYGVRGKNRELGETEVTSMNPSGNIDMTGFKFTGKAFAAPLSDTDETLVIKVSNSVFEGLSEAGSNNVTVVEFDASDPSTSVEVPEDLEADVEVVETVETAREYAFNDDVDTMYFNSVSQIVAAVNEGDADIVFYPYGRGEYYNNIGFKLTKARKSYPGAFVIDVYTKSKDAARPSLVESFIVSFDRDATDNSGASIFIEDVLDRYSEYIRCKCSENIGSYEEAPEDTVDEDGNITKETVSYDNLAMTTYAFLEGGSDGAMYTKTGAVDWSPRPDDGNDYPPKMIDLMEYAYTGDEALKNPETDEGNGFIQDTEDFDISVVFDAGYPSNVKDAILSLCQIRNTCFGILDNGIYFENGNKSAKAAIDMRLRDHNWSDYRIALYEPYTKIYDAYTGKYVWMTPIYHVVDLMTRTARDYDIFWAFAGMRRGAVSTSIKDYRYLLQGGYRDQFKDEELNPILRFTNGGDLLWGNWTSYQTPSALKNIHVVLCLQYIQRTLERNLKQYIYEFNDEYTYALIKNSVNNFLSELQSQRALESFSVSVTATDYQKRNNQCEVNIDLKVTGVIEIINVTLNVQ